MSRGGDWTALGHPTDPVGGDPDAVRAEATHYRDLSAEITTQVTRLRRIGQGTDLHGQYAQELRGAAEEVVDHLNKVHQRYTVASSVLTTWSEDLQEAHTRSLALLHQAQEAEAQMSRHEAQASDADRDPTPEQAALAQQHRDAYEAARERRQQVRAELRRLLDHLDQRAHTVTRQLDQATDDQARDSWWDHVKEWTHRHATEIKKITEVLSYVATGLAFVAILIPGVNILALLAIGFTAATLIGHTTLASAGETGWADVGLDIIALTTMGIGRIATQSLRTAHGATRMAAAQTARGQAATHRATTAPLRAQYGRILSRNSLSPKERIAVTQRLRTLQAQAGPTPRQAAKRVISAPLSSARTSSPSEVILAGGAPENVPLMRDLTQLRSTYPSLLSDESTRAANRAIGIARANYAGATFVDVSDKAAGTSDIISDKQPIPVYADLKNSTMRPLVSTW